MSGQGRERRSEERSGPRERIVGTMTRRVVALVSGHVQGVGYRWFVRGLAEAAGLTGRARNMPDGRVEVVLEGPEHAVADVLAALDGPGAPGRVTAVDARDEPGRGGSAFTTE